MASAGDTITPTDVVGFVVGRGPVRVIDVAAALGVSGRQMKEFLAIKEGQSVRSGEVLAQRQRALGAKQVRAPADGRAMVIGGGLVLLEAFPSERPVRGAIPGRVAEVIAGEGMLVEGTGALITAAALLGSGFAGPVKMAAPVPERVLRAEHIDATCHGAVLVSGVGDEVQALSRAAEFGAQGVVLGSVPAAWHRATLPLPVALTEGYGQAPMNRAAFDALNEVAGRSLYVVQRGGSVWMMSPYRIEGGVVAFDGSTVASVAPGATVHIVAGERWGAIAEVVDIVPGAADVVVRIGKERVSVPLANCELLAR
ncbi:MAG: hypothetical protein ACYC5O_20680 [Anaerolineae bacterium]